MEQTTQEKGIPLCLPNNVSWDPLTGKIQKTSDERCSLHPVPAAVKMLQEIKEPVCVVSIAGPCRDGKSYILGEVFGQMEVFPIGHIVDPETTGIWMWIVPQKFKDSRGRDFRVILLDSEGINAVTAEGQNDNQIFTLTVLLASVLIYNSKGVPKRNDLNDLNFIAHLSQRIRIRSKGDRDGQDLFRNTFPFFIWLLRDVSQKLPSDCRDFNQFFSTRVFKDSKASASDDEKQQVAESIISFFAGFESFALPIPSSDPDVMQDIGKHRDELTPNFRDGVKRFESLLKSKLLPKRSINQGEYVTGEALGTLIELYTDAINDPDAIPNMETAWDTHVRKTCSEAKKEGLEIYDQVMTQLMSSRLPCEVDEILKNHEIAQRQSMETFEAKTAELISTIIGKELRQFTKLIDEKISFWRGKNASLTQKLCEDLLVKLKREHLDPVLGRVRGPDGAKVKYVDIMNGWSKIKNDFNSKAVGSKDVRSEVFFKFNQYLHEEVMKYEEILKKMQDYDINLSKEKIARAYQEKEKRKLEENLVAIAKQEEASQMKMEMLEKRQQDELKLIKEQAKRDKEALDKQMQIVREANMTTQAQLNEQLEIVVEKEKQANKALEDIKQRFEESKNDAKAEKEAANEEFKQMQADSTKALTQLQGQLSAVSTRETEANTRLDYMIELWEADREETASMREEIRSLNKKLVEANEPGYIRRILRKIF